MKVRGWILHKEESGREVQNNVIQGQVWSAILFTWFEEEKFASVPNVHLPYKVSISHTRISIKLIPDYSLTPRRQKSKPIQKSRSTTYDDYDLAGQTGRPLNM